MAYATLENMEDYHRSHHPGNTTDIAFTQDDAMAEKHSRKRYAYLNSIGRGDLPYARATCRPDVEKRVQHQAEAYATNTPKGHSFSFPASALEHADTSRVPDWVYFPLDVRNGMYEFKGTTATHFGTYGPHGLGLSGGKKRSHRKKSHKKRSHKKRSHKKKSGKKSRRH
jgi:hypothetical protein